MSPGLDTHYLIRGFTFLQACTQYQVASETMIVQYQQFGAGKWLGYGDFVTIHNGFGLYDYLMKLIRRDEWYPTKHLFIPDLCNLTGRVVYWHWISINSVEKYLKRYFKIYLTGIPPGLGSFRSKYQMNWWTWKVDVYANKMVFNRRSGGIPSMASRICKCRWAAVQSVYQFWLLSLLTGLTAECHSETDLFSIYPYTDDLDSS